MQTINLDISTKGILPPVYTKQVDVGRKICVVITDGGVAYNIPEGALLAVWFSGSSGEGSYDTVGEASAFSVNGNSVTVELLPQMLANPGGGTLCLVINAADGTQIGLWNMVYVTEGVPGMGSAEADQYYTALYTSAAQAIFDANAAAEHATAVATGFFGSPVSIASQPVSRNVSLGEIALFPVVAIGAGLKYQWQYLLPTNPVWRDTTMTGNKTATLEVEGKESRNGYQYRCVITDSNGNQAISNAVTLTVIDTSAKLYAVRGQLLADAYIGLSDVQGFGTATVKIKDGFAEIHFSVSVTRAPGESLGDSFTYGIHPQLLQSLDANIPAITPVSGGICTYFSNEIYDPEKNDLGGTLDAKAFAAGDLGSESGAVVWVPSRIYQADDGGCKVGSWPSWQVAGYHLTGVCFGTVADAAVQAVEL